MLSPQLGVRYLQEYAALGTGGGLYHFRDQILSGGPQAFFVLNADVCSEFPLDEMLAFHREHGDPSSLVILGTTVRPYQQPHIFLRLCKGVVRGWADEEEEEEETPLRTR